VIRPESKGIVLVADDAAESLAMMNEALTSAGYTVLLAMDGTQALSITERIIPDLILLDAIMPTMEGFTACETLKKRNELHDIPVIFMTGLSDSEHVLRGLEVGGVDYITKPVNIDELLARVHGHLRNARKTRRARSALDEMGQTDFACNIHGEMLWSTVKTRELLQTLGSSESELETLIRRDIAPGLARAPERNSHSKLELGAHSLQVRYLGRPSPAEYLLRLINDDDNVLQAELRQKFLLTEREAEVLMWLSRRKTNRDSAQILAMSPRTVNKHLEQIFPKLGVENRASATAVSLGFLNSL